MACYAGFLIASAFIAAQPKQPSIKMTTFFVLTGTLASIFNGLSLSWLNFGEMDPLNTLGYVIGDVAGLAICFSMLIYGFRLARLENSLDEDSYCSERPWNKKYRTQSGSIMPGHYEDLTK